MKTIKNECALCKRKRVLRNSHIIPEFMYKPIYDEKHRLILRKNGHKANTKPLKKGIRERLLCEKCEGQISVYEKYVREILFGGTAISITPFNGRISISGLDYTKVRLFFISLIWRMSVASNHEMWKNVDLGPHQEIVRNMILFENPGSQREYGFLSIIPLFDGKIVDDWILQPDWVRTHNGRIYNFVVGGCIYLFHVSKQFIEKEAVQWLINPNGTWAISIKDAGKIKFLLLEVQKVYNAIRTEA